MRQICKIDQHTETQTKVDRKSETVGKTNLNIAEKENDPKTTKRCIQAYINNEKRERDSVTSAQARPGLTIERMTDFEVTIKKSEIATNYCKLLVQNAFYTLSLAVNR